MGEGLAVCGKSILVACTTSILSRQHSLDRISADHKGGKLSLGGTGEKINRRDLLHASVCALGRAPNVHVRAPSARARNANARLVPRCDAPIRRVPNSSLDAPPSNVLRPRYTYSHPRPNTPAPRPNRDEEQGRH